MRTIAKALSKWGTADPKSEAGEKAAKKAMRLCVENLELLKECRGRYGCHEPLQKLFNYLDGLASRGEELNKLNFSGWWGCFTKHHLWASSEKSFEDECIRWANKVEQETGQDGKGGLSKTDDIKNRFTFTESQVFFDGNDLSLPTGSEIVPAQILKQLVKSFGIAVSYKTLDENSNVTASDFLRGKITQINKALKKHEVPCKIQSRKWYGYFLSHS